MNNQTVDCQGCAFRIIFSNIKCKINICDPSLFALVIRVGKISSKYTSKRELHNSYLQFDEILEVPFDQMLISNQNTRKQKCEIMFYKFRLNRQKQTKQLVGMASVAITNQMFDAQVKKIKLTNSFDKEAFIQCVLKIELGQADILSPHGSRQSPLIIKSETPSIHELQQLRNQLMSRKPLNISQIQCNHVSSKTNSEFQNFFPQQDDQTCNDPFFIRSSSQKNDIIRNYFSMPESQGQTQIKSTDQRFLQLMNNQKLSQQRNQPRQFYQILQDQENGLLMKQFQTPQKQVVYKNMEGGNSRIKSQLISTPTPENFRKTAMIKKNLTISITQAMATNSCYFKKESLSTNLTENSQQKGSPLNKFQQFKNLKSTQQINPRHPLKNIKQSANQFSPSLTGKGLIRRLNASRQTLNSPKIKCQVQYPLACNFGSFSKKLSSLNIKQVLNVTYTPPFYVYPEYNQNNQSVINRSVSAEQRNQSRSYSKFKDRRKFQVIGAVKGNQNSFQSKLGYFQNQKNQSKLSLIDKEANPFNPRTQVHSPKAQSIQILDFLSQNGDNEFQINIKGQNAAQVITNELNNPKYKQRLTLQQIDNQTQQRYRKNQRFLKKANQELLRQNKMLRKDNSMFLEEIQRKKQLTHGQFQKLRAEVQALTKSIDRYEKETRTNNQKVQNLAGQLADSKDLNKKLQKDLKQQKSLYEYYFKTSNVNDEGQKEKQQKEKQQRENESSFFNLSLRRNASDKDLSIEYPKPSDRRLTSMQKIGMKNGKQTGITINREADTVRNFPGSDMTSGVPRAVSSKAILMLKQHLKPKIPKPQKNSNQNSIITHSLKSPQNASGFGLFQNFGGGFSGTGETITGQHNKSANHSLQK